MDKIVASLDGLERVVEKLKDSSIIILQGDLASGKTTLVKEFVKSLGIDEEVSSPTFSVMNTYEDRVFHYDIYNHGVEKFLESGLLENLEKSGFHLIEWGDEKLLDILDEYGFEYKVVKITPKGDKREYKLS